MQRIAPVSTKSLNMRDLSIASLNRIVPALMGALPLGIEINVSIHATSLAGTAATQPSSSSQIGYGRAGGGESRADPDRVHWLWLERVSS